MGLFFVLDIAQNQQQQQQEQEQEQQEQQEQEQQQEEQDEEQQQQQQQQEQGQQQHEGQRLSLIYQLTRFVQAVQSRTRWPIKFNGMLFSANRYNATIEGAGPDNRNWGGANWWQNLRLPYWTMFASGDW